VFIASMPGAGKRTMVAAAAGTRSHWFLSHCKERGKAMSAPGGRGAIARPASAGNAVAQGPVAALGVDVPRSLFRTPDMAAQGRLLNGVAAPGMGRARQPRACRIG
jgi:hypothetical protein